MSEHKIIKNFFESGYDLVLDEYYFIMFSDQKEMLSTVEYKKRFAKYHEIQKWPENSYKHKALAELSPEQNPNLIRITGRMIIEWCERGFIPHFDKYFSITRMLVMIPIEAYEYFAQRSQNMQR